MQQRKTMIKTVKKGKIYFGIKYFTIYLEKTKCACVYVKGI